ncbi:hypothetical protein REPUB_Repub01dG0252600 [Reevesia pubescens]
MNPVRKELIVKVQGEEMPIHVIEAGWRLDPWWLNSLGKKEHHGAPSFSSNSLESEGSCDAWLPCSGEDDGRAVHKAQVADDLSSGVSASVKASSSPSFGHSKLSRPSQSFVEECPEFEASKDEKVASSKNSEHAVPFCGLDLMVGTAMSLNTPPPLGHFVSDEEHKVATCTPSISNTAPAPLPDNSGGALNHTLPCTFGNKRGKKLVWDCYPFEEKLKLLNKVNKIPNFKGQPNKKEQPLGSDRNSSAAKISESAILKRNSFHKRLSLVHDAEKILEFGRRAGFCSAGNDESLISRFLEMEERDGGDQG